MSERFVQQQIGAYTAEDVSDAYTAILAVSDIYPTLGNWFWSKVVPGLADGTRLLRTVRRDGMTVGVMIAKKTPEEKKLCTVWVADAYEHHGIGTRLIREGCAWLGTYTPLATVSEENIGKFRDLLLRMGFSEPTAMPSADRPGKTEYVFNLPSAA